MVNLRAYRENHKPLMIAQIQKNGPDHLESSVSMYAAVNGVKIIACYIYAAEEYGYETFVNSKKNKTILDRILGLIDAYSEQEITGMLSEAYPEALKPFVKNNS